MNYNSFLEHIKSYKKRYSVKVIGETHFKRKIMAVEINKNDSFPTAILIAGMHAREHITTDLVLKMIRNELFDRISKFNVIVIPMANPDGIELCTGGIMTAPMKVREKLLKINMGSVQQVLKKI